MCYAIPAKIIKRDGDSARVDYGGVKKTVNVSLVDSKVGEYVLVHAGFAIEKVDEKRAKETIDLISQM